MQSQFFLLVSTLTSTVCGMYMTSVVEKNCITSLIQFKDVTYINKNSAEVDIAPASGKVNRP